MTPEAICRVCNESLGCEAMTPQPQSKEPGSNPKMTDKNTPSHYPAPIKHTIEISFKKCQYDSVSDVNAQLIEKYQKLYEQDPESRIFAPLAEGYRKMGLLNEALELATEGVRIHPHFSGGRVALGRIYFDLGQMEKAEVEFRVATELTPENVLAHQFLADSLVKLKKHKDALRAYKMLLFLAPDNQKASMAVKKLEALTADEYEEELFAMKPLVEAVKDWDKLQLQDLPEDKDDTAKDRETLRNERYLARVLSLVDAFIVRNDIDKAIATLNDAEKMWGAQPEIIKRLTLIHQRNVQNLTYPKTSAELKAPRTRQQQKTDNKIQFLQDLLLQIKNRSQQTAHS